MDVSSRDRDLAAIGSLQEPVRRALYRYVVAQKGDVSRDQAAEGVGVQRNLAAFHLDKLVEAGLLEVTFRRLSGRTGPGAGRPAKLYRRSSSEHAVSVPPRQYDLAAELLAEAVEEAGDAPARETLAAVARRRGRSIGEELRAAAGARAGRERRLTALAEALAGQGYEPRREGSVLRLANCPFHALAESHRSLVCSMNLSLLEGVVDGMGGDDLAARPDPPEAGECCVSVSLSTRKV
ncbi:MAG TPA: helix-turn-helix domain-containing protein [Acidimicrobiales bacterium]|nr:helix-turn-helix domain-containing protein [Acidimicrobiales bacterium]